MRAVFVCTPSKAFGEVNAAIPLARSIVQAGGEVWFVASPLAAGLASQSFEGSVFTLSGNREFNQSLFWLVVGKFRPDVIIFVEFYEILRPKRTPDCPLIDRNWLRRMASVAGEVVFLDFIAHVPMLREISDCPRCCNMFDRTSLRAFFRRLRVLLPCPLNEPGRVAGRCGIPYRTGALPFDLDPEERDRTRQRFAGSDESSSETFIILRTGATWQSVLAQRYGVRLYDHLSDLLKFYFGHSEKRVVVISVSSHHKLKAVSTPNFTVENRENLPPSEFDRLVLSSDLIMTDNEIGYGLAKTMGRVPGLVFINSYNADQVLARERYGTPVSNTVSTLETYRCGSVYPHKIFPIAAPADQFNDDIPGWRSTGSSAVSGSCIRLGRMVSSPFLKAELYGGEEAASELRAFVNRNAYGDWFREKESAYLARLNAAPTGVEALRQLMKTVPSQRDTVL